MFLDGKQNYQLELTASIPTKDRGAPYTQITEYHQEYHWDIDQWKHSVCFAASPNCRCQNCLLPSELCATLHSSLLPATCSSMGLKQSSYPPGILQYNSSLALHGKQEWFVSCDFKLNSIGWTTWAFSPWWPMAIVRVYDPARAQKAC